MKQPSAIEQVYRAHCQQRSDIQGHLPFLRKLVGPGKVVVEFGFRTGVSTSAFLAAGARVYTFDTSPCEPYATRYKQLVPKLFTFTKASSLSVMIPICDLLFIDSEHSYATLTSELTKHSDRVLHRIAMHDTATFRNRDKVGDGPGLQKAIDEFLAANEDWMQESHDDTFNGLTVLVRRPHVADPA